MAISLNNRVENDIRLDASSVWVLSDRKQFNYSDGIASERYLHKVFSQAQDLSSNSHELERWIKDWPSEYHLSRKRSQLLRGFNFDKSKKVLEVGCGCGAITRFLGETFDEVVSIEGSLSRAKLARLRTKDLTNVEILCAPFQEIKFKERFDIVFCIGVFEYSSSFVKADDPYNAILDYFHKILNPDGILVLAIENQFGLKYFSSSREDHTNIMFDGIEGYRHDTNKVRTFGYDELKSKIKKHFARIDFYFPYPDYKMAACVLSEEFFNKVNAGELLGNFKHRDYLASNKPLFDERFVYLELSKNKKLPFFSNSFLVIAGKQKIQAVQLTALGVLYNTNRPEKYQTVTRFVEQGDKNVWAHKVALNKSKKNEVDVLTLNSTSSKWEEGLSLHMLIFQKVKEKDITIKKLFSPCKIWFKKLKSLSIENSSGTILDGKYIDSIWRNCYIHGDDCVIIDREWEWQTKVNINVIVIRSIFWFLQDIANLTDVNVSLNKSATRSLIKKIAKTFDVDLKKTDFKEFYEIEAKIAQVVFNFDRLRIWFYIKLPLRNKTAYFLFLNIRRRLKKITTCKDIIAKLVYKYSSLWR